MLASTRRCTYSCVATPSAESEAPTGTPRYTRSSPATMRPAGCIASSSDHSAGSSVRSPARVAGAMTMTDLASVRAVGQSRAKTARRRSNRRTRRSAWPAGASVTTVKCGPRTAIHESVLGVSADALIASARTRARPPATIRAMCASARQPRGPRPGRVVDLVPGGAATAGPETPEDTHPRFSDPAPAAGDAAVWARHPATLRSRSARTPIAS